MRSCLTPIRILAPFGSQVAEKAASNGELVSVYLGELDMLCRMCLHGVVPRRWYDGARCLCYIS